MNGEPLGLTIAHLFQLARKSVVQEEMEAVSSRHNAIQNSIAEQRARDAVLNRMRAQGQAQLAGSMIGAAPGASYMLGQMQNLPYYTQLAAANRGY
jgi:hypothetical protein